MTDDSDNISQKFLEEIKNTDVSDIKNPHDRLFKWSLGRPDVMKEYLDLILPENLAKALNFKTLDSTKANYVDDLIKETFSDLVYTINKSSGEEVLISLLFEHKSSPDKISPLKLLRYITMLILLTSKMAGQCRSYQYSFITAAVTGISPENYPRCWMEIYHPLKIIHQSLNTSLQI